MRPERGIEWAYDRIPPVRWVAGGFSWIADHVPMPLLWLLAGLEVGAAVLWFGR